MPHVWLAGIALGNLPWSHGLEFIGLDPCIDVLARIGMLLLMFEVGVGLSVGDLFAVGPSALLVAVIGSVASLALGTGAAALMMPGQPLAVYVFLGGAITATSVGITARVLKDIGAARGTEARIIFGAAVLDDVLALVALGMMTAFVGGPGAAEAGGRSAAALVMKTIGFLVLASGLGSSLTPGWFRRAGRLQTSA